MDEKQRSDKISSSSYSHQVRSSEDEQVQQKWHPSSIPYRDRTLRRVCIAICILLATWTFTRSLSSYLFACDHSHQQRIVGDEVPQVISGNHTRRVSLEAHIMSKCPDAKACLQKLVVPAMERVNDKVDFELSFIGR